MNPTRPAPARRRLTVVLSILLLASLACTLPAIGGAKPTPTTPPQPTSAPSGGAEKPLRQEELPPALVETDPPAGSEIAPGAALTFFFNQAMQRATVEAALQGQPALVGSFEWLDDATVRFTPGQPFPAGAQIEVLLTSAAKAVNGQALPEPVELRFQVADSLRVSERLPKPGTAEANPSSAVVVTFNRPVVPLGADPAAQPGAFTLQPEAAGRGEWLNTSTYIFYPQPALAGGVEYRVALDPALVSSDGVPLTLEGLEPQDWTFTTALPAVSAVMFGENDRLELDGKVKVTFNQPMDTASVEQNLSLVPEGGAGVPLKYEWDEKGVTVTLQPQGLLERGVLYDVVVKPGARSLGGAPIGVETSFSHRSTPALGVESTTPPAGKLMNANFGQGYYMITLTAPLAKQQDLAALVTVEPAVSGLRVSNTYDMYTLTLDGSFQPSTTYTVTLAAGLQDRWGGTLGQPVSLQVRTETPPPQLVIPLAQAGAPAFFIPAGETGLDVRVTNLAQAQLRRASLTLDEFIASFGSGQPGPAGSAVRSWTETFSAPADRSTGARIRLDPSGAGLAPGLYSLTVNAPGLDESSNRSYLLVASSIHLTIKLSRSQAVVWAVDLAQNRPAAGLRIRLLSFTTPDLGACITNADGICSVDLPERNDIYEGVHAVAGQPGDAQFGFVSSLMSQGTSAWETGMPFDYQPDPRFVYLYTDRLIYRPGQTVNFKAVLREKDNGRYSALDLSAVDVRVMPPYDPTMAEQQPLTTLNLPVSGYGAVSGSFDLPADAQPGYYSIDLLELSASLSFQVASYRKPEFDLQAAFAKTDYQLGEGLSASISAAYYFGAPVSDLPVSWNLYSRPDFIYLPGGMQVGAYDDSWLYPPDQFAPGMGQFIAQGQAQTGADGRLVIDIPAQTLVDMGFTGRRTLVLEVSAMDESNRPVSVRAEAELHPASFYIGLRADSWSAQAGEEQGFTIQTLDWEDQPAGAHDLLAVFSRVEWVQEGDDTSPYGYPAFKKVLTEIGSANLTTDGLGQARVAFTPPDGGTYQLSVSGEGAVSELLIWAMGPGMAPWPKLSNQRLRLEADAAEYKPGQAAKIRIPNPFAGGALALVSVERSRVMRTYVRQVSAALEEFELPIEAIDAPNVYVSVILLGKNEKGQPDFRLGYLQLKVDPAALRLSVEAAFDPPQAGPGQEVKLSLLAQDASGRPVQGEFSLALVDKAALALADPNSPDIFEAFYGPQNLAVQTGMDLTASASRLVTALAGGRGGGGGGDLAANPGERTEFKDTAAWYPSIETNADGRAELTLRLPDNLTTWVADVRGLTGDTLAGEARVEIIATKPLLIRPVAPRFLVAGDHIQLGAIVQNNTGGALSADVSLEAPGLTLDNPASAVQSVEVPANGRVRVDWNATVQDGPAVDPVFRVQAGDLEDITHTERGALPVLSYTAPQTFGTAGLLAEGGERLEVVSLPRSFTPTGGELRLELTPSLAATVLRGLEALETFPDDFAEPVISRLMANAAAYRALKDFNLDAPDLQSTLQANIRTDLRRLLQLQAYDGGWNWGFDGGQSDLRLSAYALLALSQAAKADFFVNPDALRRAQQFVLSGLQTPAATMKNAEVEQQALFYYALQQSGSVPDPGALYEWREKLSPAGKGLLALALEGFAPGDERARTLVSDLAGLADRSATGASWQPAVEDWQNWSTPVYTTAVVTQAIATIDPASPLLTDAVRYMVLHRRPNGCWNSSYDSAWVLLALSQALKSTGDLQASYTYQATLNGAIMASGSAEGPQGALNPVTAVVPLSQLNAEGPNSLRIKREPGDGRLYYRAYLQVSRPAGDAPAMSSGLYIQREYFTGGLDCRAVECTPVTEAELGSAGGLVVRLTVTLPKDMYYVVVEDAIPSGAEVIDPNLKTSRQGFVNTDLPPDQQFDPQDPFRGGWGWWRFGAARIFDDHVRWIAPYLPAGTYTLTYRLSPVLAGEFQVMPAHAWQYYFPEVEGRSAGSVLKIK